jgi:16S rRNA (cytosine967-C5)-methyltransferase
MAAVSAARKAAFTILMTVERGQGHSDDLLRGKAVSALSAPDRHLATALVLGVLRWQIRIDHQLRPLLKRPDAKLDTEVRISLRMGAFQLLFMDRIPARAAIDESVELAKQAGHRFASGMVNAVLRKLSREPATPFPEDSAAELALAQAHPAWLVERWVGSYGLDAARSVCHHGQQQPVHTVRLANAEVERELSEAGIGLETGELLSAARRVVSGDVTASAAFREGRARLQDEGSQLIAEIAGHGSAILDCCAAPGGKTLILAERNPDARIVACESNPQRLAQLQERLAPAGQRVECRLADATNAIAESTFDLALADVPCSGTGTLGRNPEIRHRLHIQDLPRQAERQRAILAAALRACRPGGRVVYSTCSLEPEENEEVVAAALRETAGVRSAGMEPQIDSLRAEGILTASGADGLRRCISSEGYLRLMPGAFQTDGFFVCQLQKRG